MLTAAWCLLHLATGMNMLTRASTASTKASQVVQISASDCQRLAGVAIGGWIVVALLCGGVLGATGVLGYQWFRQQRDARYGKQRAVVSRARCIVHGEREKAVGLQADPNSTRK